MVRISGFSDEVSSELKQQIAVLKELGMSYMCPRKIDGKNIADYTLEEFLEKVKPELDSNGIKFSSIGSPIGKIALYNNEAFEGQLKKLETLVEIAKAMDCKFIRIFSFFVDKTDDYSVYTEEVIKKLKAYVEKVEGTDITLIHENEKLIYGDTPERALELYKGVNHEQFKLCYDASNYIQCKVDPWSAYQNTKEFTVYYHMKDCMDGVEVPLGMGQGRIEEILKDLKNNGYAGFLTMEPHTAKYALLKKAVYICPLIGLAIKNSRRVFKHIDKTMNIKPFETVTRKDVFVWQHRALTEMLERVGLTVE